MTFKQRGGLGDYALDTGYGFAALEEFDEVSDVDQQGGHLKEPSGNAPCAHALFTVVWAVDSRLITAALSADTGGFTVKGAVSHAKYLLLSRSDLECMSSIPRAVNHDGR